MSALNPRTLLMSMGEDVKIKIVMKKAKGTNKSKTIEHRRQKIK